MREKDFVAIIAEYINDIDRQHQAGNSSNITFLGHEVPYEFCRTVIAEAAKQVRRSVSNFISTPNYDDECYKYFHDFLFDDFWGKKDKYGNYKSLITQHITSYGKQTTEQIGRLVRESVKNYFSKLHDEEYPLLAKTKDLLTACFSSVPPKDASQELRKWHPKLCDQVFAKRPVNKKNDFLRGNFNKRRVCSIPDFNNAPVVEENDVIDSMCIAKDDFENQNKKTIKKLQKSSSHIYLSKDGSLRQQHFPEIIHKALPEINDGKFKRHTATEGWVRLRHIQTAIIDHFIPPNFDKPKILVGWEEDQIEKYPSDVKDTELHKMEKLLNKCRKELTIEEYSIWYVGVLKYSLSKRGNVDGFPDTAVAKFFNQVDPHSRSINKSWLKKQLEEAGYAHDVILFYLQSAFEGKITRHKVPQMWVEIKRKVRNLRAR